MTSLLHIGYSTALNTPSDISEHLETIRTFATGIKHATEFGVRAGVSTWALIAARVPVIECYDIARCNMASHIDAAREEGLTLRFNQEDVLDIEIDETDLLVIDTWHSYAQLSAELMAHASSVRVGGHIIMHDTTTYGTTDEMAYPHCSIVAKQWQRFSTEFAGLRLAIEHFLTGHRFWKIVIDHDNNNGLVIMRRTA